MSKHPTKLFLAGVAALALLALGTTSILAPAWAAKPGKLPLDCAAGEVAKWNDLPGVESWFCAPDENDPNTDTFDELRGVCNAGQVAKLSDPGGGLAKFWTCAADIDTDTNAQTICFGDDVLQGDGDCAPIPGQATVTDLQKQLDNLALLAFGQASAYVFVTSVPYTGALGGTSGANDKCNERAMAAGLPGQYKAWLSVTAADSPASSFDRAIGRYITPLGSRIATSWAQLINGTIDNPLDVDEFGVAIAPAEVWSNTTPTAGNDLTDADAFPEFTCTGFTSDDEAQWGAVGHTDQVDSRWTVSVTQIPILGKRTCDLFRRLYCFGQGFGTAFE